MKELTTKEFETFVSSESTSNFLQSAEMFSRYETSGRETYLLGDGKVAALAVKIGDIKGEKIFSMPGGPIFDPKKKNALKDLETFILEAKSFLKEKGGAALQISPNVAVGSGASAPKLKGAKSLGEYVQCKWISVLDLESRRDLSDDEFLASFRKTHRQNIRHGSNRYNLEVRELTFDELPILKHLAEMAGEKHGFRDQSLKYYEEMFKSFGEKLKVLAVFYEGKPVAAAMFVLYGSEVVYLYSGSDPEYNKIAPSYFLQWRMLNFARKHGFSRYNFYGVRPEPGNGVFEFKAGFRAEVEELWGTYIYPLSFLGKLYCLKKKYHKYGELS